MMNENDFLIKIKAIPSGPLLVQGQVEITLADGISVMKENPILCRCGQSGNKPYCDGAHTKVGFKD